MTKKNGVASKLQATRKTEEKRAYVSQNDIPMYSLEETIKIPQALYDDFGGKPAAPHQVAISLGISPTSSSWKHITGSAIAYGLTTGGGQANEISLTDTGKKIVAPENEGENEVAIIDACLKPRILKEFYERYDKAKFPKDVIAKNVLVTLGVPKEKVDEVYEIVLSNGRFTKIIQETKTGLFVFLGKPNGVPQNLSTLHVSIDEESNQQGKLENLQPEQNKFSQLPIPMNTEKLKNKPKVFISHGKNKKIVEQLKEILTFGQFEVVVSVEKESTAIPVPEKVFADMRDSDAAVIHVEGELELMDKEGNVHHTINQNVLIEIGAAIALYGKRFILLCESTLKLPSNLQGLYRCNYDGKELSYEATIKLLKSFNEFRTVHE